MPSKVVERKDGTRVNVVADTDAELKDAVKAVQETNPVSSIDINRPVKEGHDLVVVEQDGSSHLSNVLPDDALNAYDGNRDLDQRSASAAGKFTGGSSENSPQAKRAAELKADEAAGLNKDETKPVQK